MDLSSLDLFGLGLPVTLIFAIIVVLLAGILLFTPTLRSLLSSEEIKTLEAHLSLKRQELEEIKKKYREAIEASTNLEKNKFENQNLEEALDSLRKENESLQDQFSKIITDIQEKELEISETQSKLTQLQSNSVKEEIRNTELSTAIQTLEIRKKELELDCENLHSSVTEIEKQKGNLSELNNILKEKEEEIEEVKKELAESKNAADKKLATSPESPVSRNLDFTELDSPVELLTGSANFKDEYETLEEFNVELEKKKFHFPLRLVKAFHTSLKVQDFSSLTILSGISGTGKSTLPRLYAKFFGINFLLVPVEPGWDSRDNLLGYANPLEQKFIPTPLAKYLNKLDMSSTDGDISSDSAGLLMVMLDEMNLARVEYYFSDFLSRLENRKNIILSDKSSWNEVMIPLGHDVDTDKERSLLIGKNILFVGTMNDDETTLNIADKVIDRANILHLGKPKDLIVSQVDTKSNEMALSYQHWDKWIKQVNEDKFSSLKDFFNELNKHFDTLKRPFGHRLYSSALAYIVNYPFDKAEENKRYNVQGNHALEDQIIMHCLPKLKGLSPSDDDQAWTDIEGLLEDVNESLSERFNKLKDKAYFEWEGSVWDSEEEA